MHAMNVNQEMSRLRRMSVAELREKWAEVYGEPSRSGNRAFLVKRIIWRMQALEEGSLSERARRRAMELANDADLRQRPPAPGCDEPNPVVGRIASGQDGLPMPGSLLTRRYKGRTVEVPVLPKGFEYDGETYRSLSAVAKAATGSHWNGRLFFNLPNEVHIGERHAGVTNRLPLTVEVDDS
jgi:hypothetical protein